MKRVVGGTLTAVEMWRKAGRKTAIGVDLKGFNYLKRNCRTFCSKLTSCNARTRNWKKQFQMAVDGKEVGKRDTAPVKNEGKNCLVLGDSIIWEVGTEL